MKFIYSINIKKLKCIETLIYEKVYTRADIQKIDIYLLICKKIIVLIYRYYAKKLIIWIHLIY